MDIDPVALTLVRAWDILEPLEIPMAVMGGISLAAWNHPRFTQDVDLLLALPDTKRETVVAALLDAGFFAERKSRLAKFHWAESRCCNCFTNRRIHSWISGSTC